VWDILDQITRLAYITEGGAMRALTKPGATKFFCVTEHELREYLLYLKNERKYRPSSLKIAASGIIFFYTHTARATGRRYERFAFLVLTPYLTS
jgi:hypothetical protein